MKRREFMTRAASINLRGAVAPLFGGLEVWKRWPAAHNQTAPIIWRQSEAEILSKCSKKPWKHWAAFNDL
jgi:hypothetical protein